MIQPEKQAEEQKKQGVLDRLPKMGRVSQLILLIGVFLLIFIPLWMINKDQPEEQAKLNTTLANLQKILSVQQTPKEKYEDELAALTAGTAANKAAFPKSSQSPEILDDLMELAEVNDVYVIQTKVSTTTSDQSDSSWPIEGNWPILTMQFGFVGPCPNIQNILLALGDQLPTSQITEIKWEAPG
ncbi:MAG: hypothetical protein JSV54_02695 [Chloroflexota bacterium]|nr:MAG: hypothetical protein JSV54_02695 [Chloroflexota bacterium]